jgi:hypothetical protein
MEEIVFKLYFKELIQEELEQMPIIRAFMIYLNNINGNFPNL